MAGDEEAPKKAKSTHRGIETVVTCYSSQSVTFFSKFEAFKAYPYTPLKVISDWGWKSLEVESAVVSYSVSRA
ncbi:hypothetical protein L2E82_10523 [Cichorium intybus]|uniref:Uncharacterized protein n=1 Tax=Cichorium intybus TaxID=13427 RepID=A0ACB9GAU5_CICIN|nr:hypothetical protein L2E82_10523 [Cichorium intybus]